MVLFLCVNTLIVCSQRREKDHHQDFNLNIRFEPDLNFIYAKAEIINTADSIFRLAKCLKIEKVTASGIEMTFHRYSSGDSYEYSINGGLQNNILIEYSGRIQEDSFPKTINTLNMVRPGLIELSDHIEWLPRFIHGNSYNYRLDIDVPSSYVTVTNLMLISQSAGNSRIVTKWSSSEPGCGITIVAVPEMLKTSAANNGKTVEIYYSKLPATYIDSIKKDLLKSMDLMTTLYGSDGVQKTVRVVYSPRTAGAYARAPLLVVSENFALDQRRLKFGPARDFRLDAHEMAHYWSKADPGTPDDWINEGLAEYTALLISEEIIGEDFYHVLLAEYNGIVKNSHTHDAIAETQTDPREREINHYYRPVLFLNDLRVKYGDKKLKLFIKSLYTNFKKDGKADTGIFLESVEKNFGKDERNAFADKLYLRGSNQCEKENEKLYPVPESSFQGTWSGPLTQFGSTMKFVLNLSVKDLIFTPSVDSPDQNVTGIPVTNFRIKGDSISFEISIASAGFKGNLNRGDKIIHGVFEQRGSSYPLTLSKVGTNVDSGLIIKKAGGKIILAYKLFESFFNTDQTWENYKRLVLDPCPEMRLAQNKAIVWGSIDSVKFHDDVAHFKKEDFEQYFNRYDLKSLNFLYDSLILRANSILKPIGDKQVDLCFFIPYGGCFIEPEETMNTIYISMLINPDDVPKIMIHEYAHNLHFQRRPEEQFNFERELVSEGMAVYLTTLILNKKIDESIPFMPQSTVKWCFENEIMIKDSIKAELADTTFNCLKRFIADGDVAKPPRGFPEKTAFFAGYRIIEACISKGMKIEDICALPSEFVISGSGYFDMKP